MGGSGSKAKQAAEQAAKEEDRKQLAAAAEQQERELEMMLREAYAQGAKEAAMAARLELEASQFDYTLTGAAACFIAVFVTYLHFSLRERGLKAQQQEKHALVESQAQQLALERQRVTELAAVNDASREMMAKHEAALQRMKQQQIVTLSKLKASRLLYNRLQRRHMHLSVEVKNLRGVNGVLNQRFIASTSGAIIMACVAAGFALSAHGSGGHDSAHPHAPVSVPAVAPAAAVTAAVPAAPAVAPVAQADEGQ